MKIAIGWDGTEQGRDALRLGADLAADLDASLVIACVIDPGRLSRALAGGDAEWAKRLEGLFDAARHELDVEFNVRETIAEPAEGLREIALEEGASLLVVGGTHQGVLGRITPGSVAERLFSHASCPIVVAPHSYAARREHAGMGIIGAAYDGGRPSREALAVASRLAETTGSEVEVLGVSANYEDDDTPLGPLEPLRHETDRRIERGVAHISAEVPRTGTILHGDAAAALEERGVELDLLVVGSRGRGPVRTRILGSVAADVIRRSPCPVVVVPEGTAGAVLAG